MRSYLLFRLYGPMASWGNIAVGEMRGTETHPSRSAVLGLLGAALGIRRTQSKALAELSDSCRFAFRLDRPGTLIRDYHTTQVTPKKAGRNLPTRRDELLRSPKHKLVTSPLSKRDYLQDTSSSVCVWLSGDNPAHPLEQLASALRTPKFALSLGRKSCPLAFPMTPTLIQAESIRAAFQKFPLMMAELLNLLNHNQTHQVFWNAFEEGAENPPPHVRFFWEGTPECFFGAAHEDKPHPLYIRVDRRDQPVNRSQWLFRNRHEYQATLPTTEPSIPSNGSEGDAPCI